MTSGVGNTLTLGYDALLRPQSRAVSGVYQKRQNYTNFGTDRQSGQLNYLNYFKADGTTPKLGYRYLYDAGGNIKEVKSKTGSNALATESTFQYDKLGQLTKVTGKTNETYTYDTAGNMLSRTWSSGSYSYLTSYLYENTAWGDLLTSYKGQKLAYEGQTYVSTTSVTGTPKSGNPISYYNGTRWTMGWQGANQLISASSSGKSLSFTYDVNGLRTSKTYNGTKYQYAYAGDRLLWQSWSGNEMFFFYDEQGAPFAFRHVSSSGTVTIGYYLLNGQGDVVQIENASGTVLASYSYDPWGKLISSSGTFATINPLRYRGYYYDTETGFYYLQNRYYDPTISRFINADDPDTALSSPNEITDKNLFAYCDNNPVIRKDDGGEFWNFVVGAVGGALFGGIGQVFSNLASGKKWTEGLGTAIVTGAASGALAASGVGIFGSIVGNATIAMAGNATNQIIKNKGFKNFDVGDMLVDGVIGGIAGSVGKEGLGKHVNFGTLNKRLTNKILSRSAKAAKQGIKYYVSQTRRPYWEYLIKSTLKAAAATAALLTAKNRLG